MPPSQSLDFAKGLEKIEETSHLSLYALLTDLNPLGSSGKMSPVSCHLMEEKTLEPSLGHWLNAGMGSPTGFLTLNMSEHNDFQELSLKDEGVCSLSDILETGKVQQKYYLTQAQCEKMLRRAEESEKAMPENLKLTLEEAIQNTGENQESSDKQPM